MFKVVKIMIIISVIVVIIEFLSWLIMDLMIWFWLLEVLSLMEVFSFGG